jgi:NAD(P)-dependent dehydrogenase (short-subunit alcohol dehydrogenase family)
VCFRNHRARPKETLDELSVAFLRLVITPKCSQGSDMETKPLELLEKTALVTGASSGIGKAAALKLARAGAFVGLLGRNEAAFKEVEAKIKEAGGNATVLLADVSKPKEVEAALERLGAMSGHLDVVFANAGINGTWAPIHKIEIEEWQRTFDINLHGTFYTIKYALPYLSRRASIIVCSSVNGTRMFSNTGATAYACSKGAQVTLVKMLAVELGRKGVRVNAVCPGFIDTPIQEKTDAHDLEDISQPVDYPEGPIPLTGKDPGAPDQVAEAVLFLASERASHINGTELWVDGGQSLVQG